MYHDNDDGGHRDYVAALLDGRAERRGGLFKLVDDDRITRVGKVLRSWSLDEVPQLVNVVRGEMTLVGPRPALPNEIELYDERQRARLAGTPGITGLWQVSGRSELGYAEMIDLDLEYLEHWSILRDLRILARTPAVVLSRRGVA
jgi:lipopolysaccharide/colanic/teichoic acid biosynthesis glycosyltransferase